MALQRLRTCRRARSGSMSKRESGQGPRRPSGCMEAPAARAATRRVGGISTFPKGWDCRRQQARRRRRSRSVCSWNAIGLPAAGPPGQPVGTIACDLKCGSCNLLELSVLGVTGPAAPEQPRDPPTSQLDGRLGEVARRLPPATPRFDSCWLPAPRNPAAD
jgi:hypothetical protein